jgi:hypothetical protein
VTPLVQKFFEIVASKKVRGKPVHIKSIAKQAGFPEQTFGAWKRRSNPGIHNLQAALNTVGHELVIRRKRKTVPTGEKANG